MTRRANQKACGVRRESCVSFIALNARRRGRQISRRQGARATAAARCLLAQPWIGKEPPSSRAWWTDCRDCDEDARDHRLDLRPTARLARVSAPLITIAIAIAIAMSATVHPITDDVEALSTVPKDDVEAKNVLDDDFLKKVDLSSTSAMCARRCGQQGEPTAHGRGEGRVDSVRHEIANVKKDAKDVVNAGKEQAIGLLKEKGKRQRRRARNGWKSRPLRRSPRSSRPLCRSTILGPSTRSIRRTRWPTMWSAANIIGSGP